MSKKIATDFLDKRKELLDVLMMKRLGDLASKIIIAQIALYFFLFLSPNNKIFFPSIILFGCYLFWILEDWQQAAWLTLVAILPFSWGVRSWEFSLSLPFHFFDLDKQVPFLYFSLSAKFLISVFLLITLTFVKKKPLLFKRRDLFLFSFLILIGISTLNSINTTVSIVGLLDIFQAVVLYYLAIYFLKKRKLIGLTLNVLFIIAAFEGAWASAQFILKRPLGRILEESLMVFPYGKRAAEDIFQFRSVGTFTDPITLGIFLSLLFLPMLSQVIHKNSLIKDQFFKNTTLILCFLGIVFSLTRGVWLITFGASSLFFLYLFRKKYLRTFPKSIILIVITGFFLLLPLVIPRILSLQASLWSEYSSVNSRIELIKEAVVIIRQYPFLGVGLGNFLAAMAQNRITQIVWYFFFPVHNLYLLLAAEVGIPATIAFLGFVSVVVIKSFISKTSEDLISLKLGIFGALLVYFLSSFIYDGVVGVNMQLFFLLLAILVSLEKRTAGVNG